MVAESRSRSRYSIAKRRAYGHQALRHEQKIILNRILQAEDEEIETLEAKVASVRRHRWRKLPDGSLGEFVSVLAMERRRRGMTNGIRDNRILKKAENTSPRKWKKGRWDIG